MIPSVERFWYRHAAGINRFGWVLILYSIARGLSS